MDLEALFVDGQHHIHQLTLSPQQRQALEEGGAVARGWESAAQGAVLVSHAENKRKHILLRGSERLNSIQVKLFSL